LALEIGQRASRRDRPRFGNGEKQIAVELLADPNGEQDQNPDYQVFSKGLS